MKQSRNKQSKRSGSLSSKLQYDFSKFIKDEKMLKRVLEIEPKKQKLLDLPYYI
ncbi:MAG: hypothetical protein JW776_09760 [Candidatus Lokiarchaeota archaeon]|nr:hypothetical protein [Candidatus Lokiarchaeota archaeon]